MLDSLMAGAVLAFQWPAIGFLIAGVALGLCFGAVPGLSGLTGMSILLPFTFTMDTGSAIAFLLGMFAVTTTSDTLASVLLGVPGTAASQATILDGYPMAQRGEAPRAFGAAFTVSAFGGVFGALVLAVSIPILSPFVMSFATPEFVMLGLLGLTMIGSLSGNSPLKGLAAAALGLLVSMVGYAPQGAIARFSFGSTYLLDGLALVPVVLGLFAIPEMMELTRHGRSIADPRIAGESRLMDGVRDALRHRWLVFRSGLIGTYIGMLPGLGGAIVDWVAYGHAVQSARDKSGFGKGDVRGVLAPETANNAGKGGALMPTLVFGIPGSPPMAILLGAFLIQGLRPGPSMLSTHLDVTFAMVWVLVVANIIGAAALMVWSRQVARVATVPGRLIVPGIMLFVVMGAWLNSNQMGDWYTLLAFGAVGYAMKLGGWSRPAFILGFILGPIIESSLHLATQIHGMSWIYRPIPIAIGALIVLTLVWSFVQKRRDRHLQYSAAAGEAEREDLSPYETSSGPVSLAFGFFVLLLGVYGNWSSQAWPWDSRFFPLFATVPLCCLTAASIVIDLRARFSKTAGSRESAKPSGHAGARARELATLGWLAAIVGLTLVFPQPFVIAMAMTLYLFVLQPARPFMAVAQGAAGWLVLTFMFERLGGVIWHTPLTGG